MLCRSHFVVLRLCRDSDFPKLFIDILHECRDPLADRPEIVIVKFLSLRRHRTKECTSCIDQVLPLLKFLCIYQEIFLLRSNGRCHLFGSCISK